MHFPYFLPINGYLAHFWDMHYANSFADYFKDKPLLDSDNIAFIAAVQPDHLALHIVM